jgi:hypothetical protein
MPRQRLGRHRQVLPTYAATGSYGYPNDEAVQITAVGSGTISAVFKNNHSNGATVTPALVLSLSNTSESGQQRKLVNLSEPSYSTGTVSVINGYTFTGSSTAWSNTMVGGSSSGNNIGCIALAADDYTGAPFQAGSGALHSWYEIISVNSGTQTLEVSSMSTAGDLSYHGKGPGSGGYIIRPCVEVLRSATSSFTINGSTSVVVAESTSTTWASSDNVELAISPYPDVTGFNYTMSKWNPGGAARGFMGVTNTGARQFGFGFSVGAVGFGPGGSNSDTVAWGNAFQANNVNVGLNVTDAAPRPILRSGRAGLSPPSPAPAGRCGASQQSGRDEAVGMTWKSWSLRPAAKLPSR